MSILLEIRDYIQKFYQKYAAVLNVILRFLAAFITFFATNRVIGFNPYLDHTYTELVFAAVSVVFPAQILLFFEAVFIILHILYVSHYLAFVTAIFFAILYFVYVRFIPKDGYVILSMPVLSSFGAPYILPILLGITADPIAIIPESIGVIVYHYLQNVISVVSTSTEDSINLYHLVLKQTFNDKELYITLIVFSIVTIFVYFIRNSKIDYSFEIAIISGGFLNTILLLFMNFFMDININVFRFFITMILSVAFVWLVQLFRLSLNYAGVENLQFEDEELNAYAHGLYDYLADNGIRVEIDERAEKLGYRVREAQVKKIPYLIVLGKNEAAEGTVSYRLHGEQKSTTVSKDEFVAMLKDEIATKKNNPAAAK